MLNFIVDEKFSEIIQDITVVKDYLSICQDDTYDENLLYVLMGSCASFIIEFTQMSIEELDKHSTASLIFLLMVSESYNNRTIALSTGNAGMQNKLFQQMLLQLKRDWL